MTKFCDCILVIGAQNSSNSKRLVEVAKFNGVKNSFLISEEKDLNKFLLNYNSKQYSNIGLTAGASAPETLVQVFITKLKKDFNVNQIDHQVVKENVYFNLPIS